MSFSARAAPWAGLLLGQTVDVLLKLALIVGRLVFVEAVLRHKAVQPAFYLIQEGGGFVGVLQGAQLFHVRAHAAELAAVAGAAFLILADTLTGGGTLRHRKRKRGERKGQAKAVGNTAGK